MPIYVYIAGIWSVPVTSSPTSISWDLITTSLLRKRERVNRPNASSRIHGGTYSDMSHFSDISLLGLDYYNAFFGSDKVKFVFGEHQVRRRKLGTPYYQVKTYLSYASYVYQHLHGVRGNTRSPSGFDWMAIVLYNYVRSAVLISWEEIVQACEDW